MPRTVTRLILTLLPLLGMPLMAQATAGACWDDCVCEPCCYPKPGLDCPCPDGGGGDGGGGGGGGSIWDPAKDKTRVAMSRAPGNDPGNVLFPKKQMSEPPTGVCVALPTYL